MNNLKTQNQTIKREVAKTKLTKITNPIIIINNLTIIIIITNIIIFKIELILTLTL